MWGLVADNRKVGGRRVGLAMPLCLLAGMAVGFAGLLVDASGGATSSASAAFDGSGGAALSAREANVSEGAGLAAVVLALAVFGFVLAGPETSLCSASVQVVVAVHPFDISATASSLVNGVGAMGPIAQG